MLPKQYVKIEMNRYNIADVAHISIESNNILRGIESQLRSINSYLFTINFGLWTLVGVTGVYVVMNFIKKKNDK
jgi:hypothetical protein